MSNILIITYKVFLDCLTICSSRIDSGYLFYYCCPYEYGLKKDDMQIQSLTHLVKSNDWLNDRHIHTRENILFLLPMFISKVDV